MHQPPTSEARLPPPTQPALTIGAALEALGAQQPHAPALHVPGRATLRYGDLAGQVRCVRQQLRQWGLQPGDIVAAAIASRPELALAIATMPASCTLAPLDPELPKIGRAHV